MMTEGLIGENSSLSEFWQTLRRQWKPALAVATAVFAGSAIMTFQQTPKYRSETLILLENEETTPVGPDLDQTRVYGPKDLSTEIQILRSQALVADALDQSEAVENLSAPQVVANLSIQQAGTANVLVVSYTDTDPERAKAVLEALGLSYVDYSLEKQRSQASNGIGFIRKQLPKAQKELNEAALAIRQFQQRYGVVNPELYGETVSGFEQSLEEKAKESRVALSRTQRQYEELQQRLVEAGQNPDTALAFAILSEDSIYQNLANQLREVETQRALAGTRYRDNNPVMKNLRLEEQEMWSLLRKRAKTVLGDAASQIDVDEVIQVYQTAQLSEVGATQQNLVNQLLQVETEQAALQSQLEEIRTLKTEVQEQFQSVPQIQQVYTELQRQLEVKSQAVNYFLARQQELEIAEAQEIAPWQILKPPYLPQTPVSPDIQRNLVLGLIAGVLLGIGAAMLLQQQDQRVKQVEELRQLTRLPQLGTIPRVEHPFVRVRVNADEPRHSYQYSFFTEALRSLAMNLRHLVIETGRIKVLALTSATAAEGKTTVSYNLGVVLAELGLRVLIVDADMRKPMVHKLARVPNEEGLSTAIATDRYWREFVQAGEVENFSIISSGPNSPNPIALLNSDKMKQLISEWREAYDYVLIDTPPVGVIADAQGLVNQVDSAIFVSGMERTSRGAIGRSMEILKASQCNLAGFVANFVERGHDYYSYSYRYSYYGYHSTNGNGNGNGNGHHHANEGKVRQLLRQIRRQ